MAVCCFTVLGLAQNDFGKSPSVLLLLAEGKRPEVSSTMFLGAQEACCVRRTNPCSSLH